MEGRRGLICRRDGSGAGHLVIRCQQRAPDGSFHTRLKLDTRAGGDALNSPEPKLRALEKTRCTYRPKKPPGTVARCTEVSQAHRSFSGAPKFLRCIEVSMAYRRPLAWQGRWDPACGTAARDSLRTLRALARYAGKRLRVSSAPRPRGLESGQRARTQKRPRRRSHYSHGRGGGTRTHNPEGRRF